MTYKRKRQSWMTKAINFTIACVKHVLDGLKKTSEEQRNERWMQCFNCPHSQNEWFECDKCGCAIEEKVKWKSEKCPERRW